MKPPTSFSAKITVTIVALGGDPDKGYLGFGLGFDADAQYGCDNIGAE
jgi:hypothetical protein